MLAWARPTFFLFWSLGVGSLSHISSKVKDLGYMWKAPEMLCSICSYGVAEVWGEEETERGERRISLLHVFILTIYVFFFFFVQMMAI